MSDNESELVTSMTSGDAIALQALLHRYRRRLLEYIRRQLPNVLTSVIAPEDVFQDTCIEAFRRMRDFVPNGDDAPMRWLMTMARHRMIDLLRAQQTQKRGGLVGRVRGNGDEETDDVIALLQSLAVYHRTPSRSAAAHELAAALERSIDRLPPDYRQAIRLRHVEGIAAKDAAAQMNRTEGAFHLLCNRGLKRLRVEMRSESLYV